MDQRLTAGENTACRRASKAALLAACKQPPSGGVVVINGATQSEPTSGRTEAAAI